MFYTYSQNNSGGSFVDDDDLTEFVIVEVDDVNEANDIAQNKGIYFNGVEDERDCECCGDRWYPAYDNGDASPCLYGKPIAAYQNDPKLSMTKTVIVYYKSGNKVRVDLSKPDTLFT